MVVSQSFKSLNDPYTYVKKYTLVEFMGGLPGELSEELVTHEKRNKCWRINCDVGEAAEELGNEL